MSALTPFVLVGAGALGLAVMGRIDTRAEKERMGNAMVLSRISDRRFSCEASLARDPHGPSAPKTVTILHHLAVLEDEWKGYDAAVEEFENLSFAAKLMRSFPTPPDARDTPAD